MVKFIKRKRGIIYPLFLILFWCYVVQQLHVAIENLLMKSRDKQYFTHKITLQGNRMNTDRHIHMDDLAVDRVMTMTFASPPQTHWEDSNTFRIKSQLSNMDLDTVNAKQISSPFKSGKNVKTVSPRHVKAGFRKVHTDLNLNSVFDLKLLARLNIEQHIRNIEKFPLKLGNDSVVLLVQVHNRLEDLKILIESLRRVRYINESLLLFSHDFYSKTLFDVIQSIDFCPVLQLFFPYSIQFYDKSFPGDSIEDCPKTLNRTVVEKYDLNCYNAKFNDSFGHYREGRVTQTKHHWVWKQHFVFDKLRVLRHYQGTVLRVEDDYYVAEDTIHVIRALNKVQSESCPECLMYILGDRENAMYSPHIFKNITGVVEVLAYSANIGRGMAYRAQFWRKLKSCARTFCRFDDYNWDWSLQRTSVDCMKGLYVMKPIAGRVFHIGACRGFHRNDETCDNKKILSRVLAMMTKVKQFLYPKHLNVQKYEVLVTQRNNGNGGWSDPRDHLLCMKVFHNKTDTPNLLSDINDIISM